jgi:hypothetical protein
MLPRNRLAGSSGPPRSRTALRRKAPRVGGCLVSSRREDITRPSGLISNRCEQPRSRARARTGAERTPVREHRKRSEGASAGRAAGLEQPVRSACLASARRAGGFARPLSPTPGRVTGNDRDTRCLKRSGSGQSLSREQSREGASRLGDPRPLALRTFGGCRDRKVTIDPRKAAVLAHGFRWSGMFGRSKAVLVETSICRSRGSASGQNGPARAELQWSSRGLRTSMKTCGSRARRPTGTALQAAPRGCLLWSSPAEGASISRKRPALTCRPRNRDRK